MRFIATLLILISLQANAETRHYFSHLNEGVSFDECVTVMEEGIELINHTDARKPNKLSVNRVFIWRKELYQILYFQNYKGDYVDRLSCSRMEETERPDAIR